MGFFRSLLKTTAIGTGATVGTFALLHSGSRFVPANPATDPLTNSALYAQRNPQRNPPLLDVCVKRVPLSKIRPELLEKKGALAEAFCAGIWGTYGYTPQRMILERNNRKPETVSHLWEQEELLKSTYEVGTLITDHFEVVQKTPESIVVRCGDSPLNQDYRDSDGLFEMAAEVKPEEGVAEFRLKSAFFKSAGTADKEPMDGLMLFLHKQYTKFWMESAVKNCTK